MAYFEELSEKQKSIIPQYVADWRSILFSTKRIDKEQAILSIYKLYELLKISKPKIVFFASPYLAARCAKDLIEITDSNLIKQPCLVYKELPCDRGINAKIDRELQEAYNSISHYCGKIADRLMTNEGYIIDEQLSAKLILDLLPDRNHKFYSCDGTWFPPLKEYTGDGAYLDFHFSAAYNTLYRPFDLDKWLVIKNLLINCGWIFPFDSICLLSDRPNKISFDSNNRLHKENGYAIEFSDGFGLKFKHGKGEIYVEQI